MTLTAREKRDLLKILGSLSEFLESVIECHTLPTGEGLEFLFRAPAQRGSARIVASAREEWRRVEDWKIRLEAKEKRKSV